MNVYDDPSRHGMICSKTACDWCSKPRTTNIILKQCKGCKVTFYCSKACQVASWPSHKYICTSRSCTKVPLIYEALGRATVAEVVQAAKDWTVAHRLGLFMLTTVLVELGGGVDVALNEPHVVIFELGPPKAYDGSPSTAFKLEAGSYTHRDDLKGSVVESQWSAPATAMREAIARECRDNPDVAGLVPVTFCLRGSPIAPNTSFPLCRPRVPEGRTVDARTRAALQQLIALLSPVINDGLVLSVPTDASQIVPDMGRLVQGRKSWVWRPPLHVGAKSLAEFLRWCELKYSDPGPSPSDSFTAYHQLWPYHLIQSCA